MIDFELRPLKSYSTICPRCAHTRQKHTQRCLLVHRDKDGKVRAKCYHSADCDYGGWTCYDDPDPSEVDHVEQNHDNILCPIPKDISLPTSWQGGQVHWYKTIDGSPLYGVIRWKHADGRKTFSPLVLCRNGEWAGGSGVQFPKDKTLYGAENIKQASKILIVEGEKAADAGNKLLGGLGYAVISWRGGANAAANQPWELLRGKSDVTIWPDNDEAGLKVAKEISRLLPVPHVKLLDVSHLPPKSDIADNPSPEDVKLAFSKATNIATGYKGPLSIEDILEKINNRPDTVKTGYAVFDKHIELPNSGIITVLGRTGHGKTLLGIAFAMKWLAAGKKVVFLSYEEPADRLIARFVRSLNPTLSKLTAHLADEFKVISSYVTSGLLEIYDQDSQISADRLLRSFDFEGYKDALIVVDNLQILPFAPTNLARYLVLKQEFIDPLRILANKRGFLAMVLGQLSTNEINPAADTPREGKDICMASELVLKVWNKGDFAPHPYLNLIHGNYAIQVLKNRNGEFNFVFDCRAIEGAQLEVDHVMDNKTVRAYLNKALMTAKRNEASSTEDFGEFSADVF